MNYEEMLNEKFKYACRAQIENVNNTKTMNNKTKKLMAWKERFDEEFPLGHGYGGLPNKLKAFIGTELAQARKEGAREVHQFILDVLAIRSCKLKDI